MKTRTIILASLIVPFLSFSQPIKKTKIQVLATPHLSRFDSLQPFYLHKVNNRLQEKNFDVIAIEKMPPELLLEIKSRPGAHWRDLYQSYGEHVTFGLSHQKRTGLSFEEAEKRLSGLITMPSISEKERIDLINALLCTYDIWSAALHYKGLKDKGQLDTTAQKFLEKLSHSKNEISLIGIAVAEQLQLKQLAYIDNLQDEALLLHHFPSFIQEYEAGAQSIQQMINKNGLPKKNDSLTKEALKHRDFYELYSFLNSKEYTQMDHDSQWGIWFSTNFNSGGDRARYALWEMRNLMIVANIMKLAALNPGKKILVIIGASHKYFLEKYLQQMPDIELLEF